MKKAIGFIAVLALAGVVYGAAGNPVTEMQWQNWVGYRDYNAYGGAHIDFGTYWPVEGGNVPACDDISLRYTPSKTVTFNTVRTWWKGGGGGNPAPVTLWVEGNTLAPNYYAGITNYGNSPEGYNNGWNIPDGVVAGGGSNVASVTITGAAQTADFVLPQPVTVAAGQIFHVRLSVDANIVDPLQTNLKLRLATSAASSSTVRLGNPNYRTRDGVPVNNGTSPAVSNGDDGMAAMSELNWYSTPDTTSFTYLTPPVWGEGDFYNNGISGYGKMKEPAFELLNEGATTGVGQGATETTPNVSTVPVGEVFKVTAESGLAGTYADKLAMFIVKGAAVEPLSLQIRDAAGTILGSGTKAAADIVTNTWVVVQLDNPVSLVAGQTYQATATAGGTAGLYKVVQHNFTSTVGVPVLYSPTNDASYLGADAFSTASATGDVLFMVPEPATLSLLVLGGAAALLRRRRS